MLRLLLRSPHSPILSRSFLTHHPVQSGHNKWSKIKDKKGANDAQKSILYTKYNREITVAVKVGGSADPSKNVQLATVLKKAKEQGVPKENIEKALANSVKNKDQSGERLVYEALAHKTVGLIIECITDNTNRTIHNVREILTSHGAHMAPVNFMFTRRGCVTLSLYQPTPQNIDDLMALAIQNEASDIDENPTEESSFWVFCEPSSLAALEESLEGPENDLDVTVESAELVYVPVDRSPPVDLEVKEKVKKLVEDLEAIDDIHKVWTSLDYPV